MPGPEALLTTDVVPASLCFLHHFAVEPGKEKCIVMKNIDKPYESPKAEVINIVVNRNILLETSGETEF